MEKTNYESVVVLTPVLSRKDVARGPAHIGAQLH